MNVLGGGYYGLVIFTSRPQIIHVLREHTNLNLEWIASNSYMYIDIGERIAGKQDGPSLIIEGPPRPPPPPPE